MVYQAILRRNDSDGSKDRYVMTAPDADTMDELYRTVRDCKGNVAKIERLAPDYYTWEGPDGSVSDHARDYKIIFTHLPDAEVHSPPPNLHNEPRTNAISGRSFYIRSKSNPNAYWYCPAKSDDVVIASTVGRTRFHIELEDSEDYKTETVMVGKDDVYITTARGSTKLYVKITKLGLKVSEDEATHRFSDLKNRFVAAGDPGLGADEERRATVMAVDKHHGQFGEVWELVS